MELFDGDYWRWKALEDYIAFKEMNDFIGNQKMIKLYQQSIQYIIIDNKASSIPDENDIEKLKRKMEKTLKHSLEHYASLTLVSLCTTFEVTVRDIFYHLFIKYPSLMHDYVGSESHKGFVSLHEIIESSGHKELIKRLANKSSSKASKGKYGEIILRVNKLCKTEKNENLIERINSLQIQRNKIVHEKKQDSLSLEDVDSAHNIIDESIELLCKSALKKDIPGRYINIRPELSLLAKDLEILE